tara:strand:- start:161 stop:982 length:822 start_codon:yes stop_codon:yes gene_type:complete
MTPKVTTKKGFKVLSRKADEKRKSEGLTLVQLSSEVGCKERQASEAMRSGKISPQLANSFKNRLNLKDNDITFSDTFNIYIDPKSYDFIRDYINWDLDNYDYHRYVAGPQEPEDIMSLPSSVFASGHSEIIFGNKLGLDQELNLEKFIQIYSKNNLTSKTYVSEPNSLSDSLRDMHVRQERESIVSDLYESGIRFFYVKAYQGFVMDPNTGYPVNKEYVDFLYIGDQETNFVCFDIYSANPLEEEMLDLGYMLSEYGYTVDKRISDLFIHIPF